MPSVYLTIGDLVIVALALAVMLLMTLLGSGEQQRPRGEAPLRLASPHKPMSPVLVLALIAGLAAATYGLLAAHWFL